jgi:adenylate cyclase class 2
MAHTEYEVRVLEINKEELIERLKELKATLVSDSLQRRYVYDLKPVDPNRWIRLRTNGTKTTLAIKQVESAEINGTKEMEIEVSDFKATNEILNALGYVARGIQENYRMKYDLNGVEVDIDTWPKIPTYLEIEGKTEEEVYQTLDLLKIDRSRATSLDVLSIYEQIYHIPDANKNLSFEDGKRLC